MTDCDKSGMTETSDAENDVVPLIPDHYNGMPGYTTIYHTYFLFRNLYSTGNNSCNLEFLQLP